MSKLEALLQGVNVDFIKIASIAELKRGKTITAKQKIDGDIPVISGGQKPAYYNAHFNRENETITIAGSGAYAGFVSYWNEPIFVSDAFSIKPNLSILNTRYVYYNLLTKQNCIYGLKKGVGVPHVYPKDLENLLLPIPCPDDPKKSLEIQQEIVRILDELTSLTNQLTTELETERQNRKKQFEFFREQLFRFEEEVTLETLGSECDIFTGGEAPNKCIKGTLPNDTFTYPIYGNGIEIYGYTDSYKIDKDAVTISSIGANTGNVYYRKAFFTPIIRLKVVIPKKDNLKSKFIYHYLNTIKISTKSSSVPNINASDVKKIKIPIPSLEDQERIVKLLDQFDATHSAIEEEITKEIKLRTQQYEYYREKLLSFPQN